LEIERINPKGLFVLDAFTQIVRTGGSPSSRGRGPSTRVSS
jgi:hypothetical protein